MTIKDETMTIQTTRSLVARRPGRARSVKAMAAASLLPLMALGGCAAFPAMDTRALRPLNNEQSSQALDGSMDGASATDAPQNANERFSRSTIPAPTPPAANERQPATEAQIAALLSDELVDTNLSPQPIPQFVASVFGGVLNIPFVMGPDVSGRTEMVAGGSGGPITKRALFALSQRALSQYGIELYIDGNAVTVGASRQGGAAPEIVRGRTASNAPGRVVHFFTVQTIEAAAIQTLLNDLYPNLRGTRITQDTQHNALVISGSGRDVAQVVRALREIDQPRFSGAEVLRIEPSFWATEALHNALEQVLVTEGYLVSRQAMIGRSVVILSFPSANQILVFGRDPEVMERVRHWADTLDQPASLGDKASTFVYQVRNTDAQSLGQLAIGQSPQGAQQRTPVGVPGAAPAERRPSDQQMNGNGTPGSSMSGGTFMNGRVLVDPIGNRIIFNGTATDFAHLKTLLATLDQPAPQVSIEVIIAEVTLTDNTAIGVQLFGDDVRGDGSWSAGTGGISLPGGGVDFSFTGPDLRAKLSAAASNGRVNILQRPQMVTRSGSTAHFQVGTDVPIITSQRATQTQTGGDGTDILQSVQYRQTGVILELTPVVYGDRVDIQINQEISEIGKSTNPAIASPPILNRSLTTQIAIADGWTGVLGGLISNNYSKTNSGVPFLKDIPVVGSAFQTNQVSGARTELLMLITPTVIHGDEEMADLADRYTSDMRSAFRTGRGWSYTLTPFNFGFGLKGVGFDLPASNRPSDRQRLRQEREAQRRGPAVTDSAILNPEPETVSDDIIQD